MRSTYCKPCLLFALILQLLSLQSYQKHQITSFKYLCFLVKKSCIRCTSSSRTVVSSLLLLKLLIQDQNFSIAFNGIAYLSDKLGLSIVSTRENFLPFYFSLYTCVAHAICSQVSSGCNNFTHKWIYLISWSSRRYTYCIIPNFYGYNLEKPKMSVHISACLSAFFSRIYTEHTFVTAL